MRNQSFFYQTKKSEFESEEEYKNKYLEDDEEIHRQNQKNMQYSKQLIESLNKMKKKEEENNNYLLDDEENKKEKNKNNTVFVPQSAADYESLKIAYPKYSPSILPYISPLQIKSPSQRFRERWSYIDGKSPEKNNINIDSDYDIFDFSDNLNSSLLNTNAPPSQKNNNVEINQNNNQKNSNDLIKNTQKNYSQKTNNSLLSESGESSFSSHFTKQKTQANNQQITPNKNSDSLNSPKMQKPKSNDNSNGKAQTKDYASKISQLKKDFENDFPSTNSDNENLNGSNSPNKEKVIGSPKSNKSANKNQVETPKSTQIEKPEKSAKENQSPASLIEEEEEDENGIFQSADNNLALDGQIEEESLVEVQLSNSELKVDDLEEESSIEDHHEDGERKNEASEEESLNNSNFDKFNSLTFNEEETENLEEEEGVLVNSGTNQAGELEKVDDFNLSDLNEEEEESKFEMDLSKSGQIQGQNISDTKSNENEESDKETLSKSNENEESDKELENKSSENKESEMEKQETGNESFSVESNNVNNAGLQSSEPASPLSNSKNGEKSADAKNAFNEEENNDEVIINSFSSEEDDKEAIENKSGIKNKDSMKVSDIVNEEEDIYDIEFSSGDSNENSDEKTLQKSKDSLNFSTPKLTKNGESFIESSQLSSNLSHVSDIDNK